MNKPVTYKYIDEYNRYEPPVLYIKYTQQMKGELKSERRNETKAFPSPMGLPFIQKEDAADEDDTERQHDGPVVFHRIREQADLHQLNAEKQ